MILDKYLLDDVQRRILFQEFGQSERMLGEF